MASNSQAQPGSHESGSGGETSTTGGDSKVDVQEVLNTKTTGKPPENVNTVPKDSSAESNTEAKPGSQESGSGGETSTTGGDSKVDVQEVLDAQTTGEPSENANS